MNMKKQFLGLAAIAVLGILGSPGGIAGMLLEDHFGVTLSLGNKHWDSKQHAYTYPFDLNSFVPTKNTATTDYMVGDWYGEWSKTKLNNSSTIHGDHPGGDEPYDVEAMYFDDDPNNVYIAVVTSFPIPPGLTEARKPYRHDPQEIVTGDIALDLGLNAPAADGFRYDYGVNLNHEKRTANGGVFNGSTVGNEVYRTANSDWYLGNPHVSASGHSMTNFDPNYTGFSGSLAGTAQVNAYEYTFPGGKEENGFPTYVIEATIPKSILVGLAPGQQVGVSWLPGCRNDSGNFVGDIDAQAVPEPATLLLFAMGGAALAAGKRIRNKKTNEQPS